MEYRLDGRIAALATNFAGRTHGALRTYQLGCRCGECRAVKAKANRDDRAVRQARQKAAGASDPFAGQEGYR